MQWNIILNWSRRLPHLTWCLMARFFIIVFHFMQFLFWFSIYGRHGVLNFSLCHKGPEINIGQISWEWGWARTWQQRAEVPWRVGWGRAGQGCQLWCCASTLPVCPRLGTPSTTPGRCHPLPRLLLPSPHWNSTSSIIIQAPKLHI